MCNAVVRKLGLWDWMRGRRVTSGLRSYSATDQIELVDGCIPEDSNAMRALLEVCCAAAAVTRKLAHERRNMIDNTSNSLFVCGLRSGSNNFRGRVRWRRRKLSSHRWCAIRDVHRFVVDQHQRPSIDCLDCREARSVRTQRGCKENERVSHDLSVSHVCSLLF